MLYNKMRQVMKEGVDMISYVGFIRGLNVGGKNKVAMSDLRFEFEQLNYQSVSTIGNTGVIFFDSDEEVENDALSRQLTDKLGLEIKIVCLTFKKLLKIKSQLPDWWNQEKEWRHNVLFLLDEIDISHLTNQFPTFDESIEKAFVMDEAIFWASAFTERKDYYRSQYSKLMKHKVYKHVTIRNGNTLNKVFNKIEKTGKKMSHS